MLVLTRRKQEQIVIKDKDGAEIVIRWLPDNGSKVRIGIEAARDKFEVSRRKEEASADRGQDRGTGS